jgi:hypothetical protein
MALDGQMPKHRGRSAWPIWTAAAALPSVTLVKRLTALGAHHRAGMPRTGQLSYLQLGRCRASAQASAGRSCRCLHEMRARAAPHARFAGAAVPHTATTWKLCIPWKLRTSGACFVSAGRKVSTLTGAARPDGQPAVQRMVITGTTPRVSYGHCAICMKSFHRMRNFHEMRSFHAKATRAGLASLCCQCDPTDQVRGALSPS